MSTPHHLASSFCPAVSHHTRIAGAAILLAFAAAAGPEFYRPWMPDFDQRRDEGVPGAVGFPNDGRMYCSPAATMNMLVYIDRHGYPTMTPFGENRNFFSQSGYNDIGDQILDIASMMSTSATTGTGSTNALNATTQWVSDHEDGWKFIVARRQPAQFLPVTPQMMKTVHGAGGVLVFSIGWYTYSAADEGYTKDGGHVVTGIGVRLDTDGTPILLYRDPADSNTDPTGQDTFRVAESRAELGAFSIEYDTGQFRPEIRYRLTGYSSPAFLAGMRFIIPLYGMTSNADLTQLQITHPFGFIGSLQPESQTVTMPPGVQISGILANVMGDNLVLGRPISGGGPSSIYRIDPDLLEARPVLEIPVPGPLDVSRKGCVWYIDNRALKKGVPNDQGGFDVGPGLLLPAVVDALASHDGLDRVLVLMGNSLSIYDEDMALEDTDTLPGQVVLSGPVSMSGDPHNPLDLLITSLGSTGIYRIRRAPAIGRWMFVESIPVPSTEDPTDLEVGNDGRIFFRSRGRTFERRLNAGGGWGSPRDPVFSINDVGGPFLEIPFSRDSFDPDDAHPNDDINIFPPSMPPSFTTCDADLTTSSDPSDPSYGFPDGVLDASDFFYFLDRFVEGNLMVCDLTGDSDPNNPAYGAQDGALDASDFFYYLDLFASGCD